MKKGSYLDCLVTKNKISPPWIIALAISIQLKKKKKLTPNYMRINIPDKIKTSGSSYYFCSLLNNQAHSPQLRSTLSGLKPLITYLLLLFFCFGGHRYYIGQIITYRSDSPLGLADVRTPLIYCRTSVSLEQTTTGVVISHLLAATSAFTLLR